MGIDQSVVERLMDTLRRDCLDHVIALNECHLRGVVAQFSTTTMIGERTFRGQWTRRTVGSCIRPTGGVVAFPELGGLHHHFGRLAA